MRTLLVDDSRTMRGIIRSIMTPLRLDEVEEAEDAPEAIAALDATTTDLAIIDGGLDGALDLVREARRRNAHMPIVMLCADTGADRIRAARAAGVTRYVVKPFTPDILSQHLDEVIDGATSRA